MALIPSDKKGTVRCGWCGKVKGRKGQVKPGPCNSCKELKKRKQ